MVSQEMGAPEYGKEMDAACSRCQCQMQEMDKELARYHASNTALHAAVSDSHKQQAALRQDMNRRVFEARSTATQLRCHWRFCCGALPACRAAALPCDVRTLGLSEPKISPTCSARKLTACKRKSLGAFVCLCSTLQCAAAN